MPDSAPRLSAATLVRRLGPGPTRGEGSAYRVLAHHVRSAVLDGRLAPGTGLPSERELAVALSVSRTTVAAAYTVLRADGWLDSRRGSGSRLRVPGLGNESTAPAFFGPLGTAGQFGTVPGQPAHPDLIDLSVAALPAPEQALAAALAAAMAELPALARSDGYLPFGLPQLRERVAARYTAAGAPTRAGEILITNGAQHAFSLALQELSTPGAGVLVECPTYPVALDAIRAGRRTPLPFGLTAFGGPIWDLDLLAVILRASRPRLAYLMPDFQNPTGGLMDQATREQLIALAGSADTTLLIDESFRELPFGDPTRLPPPMAALSDAHRVLSLGSMSKAFWGGLRVGWIRAAPNLINRLTATRALGDMAGSVLDQLVSAHLLADPEPVLAARRAELAAGARTVRAALAELAPDWQVAERDGGAFVWVRLPGPFAGELARLAPSVGVRIAPGPRFGPDGTMDAYLRLPITETPDRLFEALRRLTRVADRAAARPPVLAGWIA